MGEIDTRTSWCSLLEGARAQFEAFGERWRWRSELQWRHCGDVVRRRSEEIGGLGRRGEMVAGMRRSSSILARCRWKVVVGRSTMRALSMVPDSAKATHLGGIPRRIILTTVGAFAKLYTTVLNSTQVGLFFVALLLLHLLPSINLVLILFFLL